MKREELVITCSPGLENILAEEIENLGFQEITKGYCGVYVPYNSFDDVYIINYCSRLASRVLLPMTRFRCRNRHDLYNAVRKIEWSEYMSPSTTFAIDANVTHSELRNSLYAAQVVKDGICDYFRDKMGSRPSVDVKNPQVQLNLFIREGNGILSFDTSGTPLHKRGYRQETVEAPLQETLAAACLTLAGYQGNEVLCDPCCGSGTFLIEAALIASQTAPGYLRQTWGFLRHPDHSQEAWLKIKVAADNQRIPLDKEHFYGNDVAQGAVRACKINLRASGFSKDVEVVQRDFRDYSPPKQPTFIISNPPHGIRLNDEDHLVGLYRSLGDYILKQLQALSKVALFVSNQDLIEEMGVKPHQIHSISSGGTPCYLLIFEDQGCD
jgi:putative N6-adenine-specific DNA methylase